MHRYTEVNSGELTSVMHVHVFAELRRMIGGSSALSITQK